MLTLERSKGKDLLRHFGTHGPSIMANRRPRRFAIKPPDRGTRTNLKSREFLALLQKLNFLYPSHYHTDTARVG